MWKIVQTDNFNRESVAEYLVADNIKSEKYAERMCSALRDKFSSEHGDAWFKVVPDGYKLWGGMEEFV